MEAPGERAGGARAPDRPRSRHARRLLPGARALGRGGVLDRALRHDGQVAERLPDAVALRRGRQQAGRDHGPDRRRARHDALAPGPASGSASRRPRTPSRRSCTAVARATAKEDPVTGYARAVADGRILTNRLVRLACERHLADLSSATARGLRFDLRAASHAIDFFGFLRHSKGEWAGQTFALAPWQAFVVGCLFGWKRSDGLRRFRTAYCAVPRKNGKAPSPPASAFTCWSPTASTAPRSTPPQPPATRRGSCSTKPSAWSRLAGAQAPGRGADQQPATSRPAPRASCRCPPTPARWTA